MSASSSPQTLFRFVSLRNPNLVETAESNLGFVHRPIRMEGVFDQVIQTATNNSKFQALLVEATNFESVSIKSVTELENEGLGKLLEIGKSIPNQNKLSSNDLKLCKDDYIKFIIKQDLIKKLWDNLIYQVITQKDFYVKESIAHIIKALHIGYAQTLTLNDELEKINGKDLIVKSKNAIIVLPKAIFEDNSTTTSAANKGTSQDLSVRQNNLLLVASQKNLTEQNHSFEKDNFVLLKKELEVIQKKYNRDYEKEYKLAYDKYNINNASNQKAYYEQLEVIQELQEEKATEAEIKSAVEKLEKIPILPFEFQFKKELNWDDIYKNLSTSSFAWFLNYFSDINQDKFSTIDYANAIFVVVSDEELTIDGESVFFNDKNYTSIIQKIDTQIQQLSKSLLNQVALQQVKFASIGGVLVPVSKNNTQTVHLSYVLNAYKPTSSILKNTNLGYISLQVMVENESWSVSHALITAKTNLGNQTERFETIQVVENQIKFPPFLKNKFSEINDITIQLFFSNGRETIIELEDVSINNDLIGVLGLQEMNTNKTNAKVGDVDAMPKHFGLKRLGVAEYLKVVQTVHAYVPGEVSNIENVMASELRHKSVTELTRTEDTLTTTKSQEIEKVSDTTKTNRAEMQTEVAKEIDKIKSFEGHANFTYDTKMYKLDTGASYASTNAQHISNMQAVTKSKEITERAMERVQSKISEERILKIIQEVSQTNVHEYDNRGNGTNSPKHITGVYRWVDKKMKNQIYNYGKRTMFEFMIPEPAKLHRLAHATKGITLVAPEDPRTATGIHAMPNSNIASAETIEYWANHYLVNLAPTPINREQILNANGTSTVFQGVCFDADLQVMENYVAKSAIFEWSCTKRYYFGLPTVFQFADLNGLFKSYPFSQSQLSGISYTTGLNLSGTFNYKVQGLLIKNFTIKIKLACEPTEEFFNAWKLESFNLIIAAYEEALAKYNAEIERLEAEQESKEGEQKETQANFYRIIESDLLKHNCIAYLLQDYFTPLGQNFTNGDKMENFQVILNDNLDQYTAMAKFLEQAFEWSIKDYTFYPYYWADRKQWQEMYLTESIDPLFRSFLQAGLARVIVTVKPGFEEAVQYFLVTGKVWFGGETPVIGDPLYMSIAQEMQEPTGIAQGNYWITRIPTTLTILQAKSTGLEVTQALPIFPELEPEKCENPAELELEAQTEFTLDDIQMVASESPSTLANN